MTSIYLKVDLSNGIERDDVITYINAQCLCAMEEDDKLITGWEWAYTPIGIGANNVQTKKV
jgi:hypothetical protein